MKKIVYAYMCMDILHPGHIRFIKNVRNIAGDTGKVVLGILTDNAVRERKPNPLMSFEERFEVASLLKLIDIVMPQNTYLPIENILKIKPSVLIESTSHTESDLLETRKVMAEINGEVIVLPYTKGFSSSDYKRRIKLSTVTL